MTRKQRAERADRDRVEALWEQVWPLPAAQRQSFLNAMTDDTALRKELESLLAGAERAETFFDRFSAVLQEAAEAAAQEDLDEKSPEATAPSGETVPVAATDPLLGRTVGHYRIEARLGEGGMGVVYRALDTRLRRTVALKFLPAGLNNDLRHKQRFLIEARAAAALDHPNICNIHEIGGNEETPLFIAMAHYPGETLEQVLQGGPLPLPLALGYATQIARGLSAAHHRGIIHRDVKPGNIAITAEGVIKLLDFGIARMPDASVSQPGLTPGTIAYMSPEQVTSRTIDHRSDLWSLGVVLYEMCTGVRPFRGDDHGATLHAILHEQAIPPSAIRGDVPAHIDRLLDRLLEKDPDQRYLNADELVAELESGLELPVPEPRRLPRWSARRSRRGRLLLKAAVAAGLAAAAWLLWSLAQPRQPTRILVADAAGDTLFGDRVSEQLRQRLASPRLTVVGRPSLTDALLRMGREPEVRLTPPIARELAIREGLKGYVHVTVDRIGNAFTLGALLVDPASGDLIDHHQTTAMNEAELTAATDRLAEGIRQALGRSLPSIRSSTPMLAVTTDSISALRTHLRAVQANRDGDYLRGVHLLDEAIAIDPQFADAHQTRAFALEQIGLRAGRGQTSVMRAEQLRHRLRPHERYSVEADYFWHVEGDLTKAIRSLRNSHQAIEDLVPGRILNRRSYGLALMLHGDLVEAENVLQTGRRFAPCPATTTHLISVLYALGRGRDAREVLEQASVQWPTNPWLGMDRAHFLARAGKYREAHEAVRRLHQGFTLSFALRAEAVFDAVEGRLKEANGHLRDLRTDRLRHGMLAPALEVTAAIGGLRLVAGDTMGAVKEVEAFLARHSFDAIDAAERPYLSLALFFADAREPERARQLLADYDTLVDAGFKGPDRWMQHRVRASLFMAIDSPLRALNELRDARNADRIWSQWLDNPLVTVDQRPELARVYERLGQADSAIAVYARYLDAAVLYRAEMDAFHQPFALQRLAMLYEKRNQPLVAARYRRQLAELWRGADSELKATWGID
jgi:tetratricopeptide (TPR) repeat protein